MTGKPAILIFAVDDPGRVISEVTSGIEEEGVFYEFVKPENDAPANALAEQGAKLSRLDVGIGIDCNGCVALHYQKMTKPLYQLLPGSNIEDLRKLGNNAARLVKGIPLHQI